jgi:polyribonucleotide nucleotidyltransferase
MDIKIKSITPDIMATALEQARIARLSILEKMLAVIPEPRSQLKPHTPRISILHIPVDKIGAVIGPGGKTIRGLQEETKTRIDIEEDGTIFIAATDIESELLARDRILSLTESPEIGRIYTGRVVRVTDFGAFVEILPNTDGMVHISQLDSNRVERVEDVARMGDEITVMVTDIDPSGKIRLSRQAVLEGWTAEEAMQRDRMGGRPQGGARRGSGGGSRGDRNRGGRDRYRK